MNDHIYKKVELTGSSKTSIEEAIQNAITRASHTLRNIHWFEVVETRGYIENGKVDYWQVTIKLGFRLDEES
jgi:flavin-binding protein dodecin